MTAHRQPRPRWPAAFLSLALSASFLLLVTSVWPWARATAGEGRPTRIISLVPALTEILFAIGAGPEVIAVSSFDTYPPGVKDLERVGALLDPDLERILALAPDLVVVYESQTDLRRQLERAGIPTFPYRHGGLPGVAETIVGLGARIGREREAQAVAGGIDRQLADVRRRVAGRHRPTTLLVFGREALALRSVYASGGTGFLHDMLTAAGGDNVFAGVARESVQASTEIILARRPEVVLEVRGVEMTADARAREIAVWRQLPGLPAVKAGRVLMITDPRVIVPGPRVAEGTALIARALHPGAFEDRR